MELYLLDESFNPMAAPLDGIISFVWSRKYYECGSFTIKLAPGFEKFVQDASYIYYQDYGECAEIERIDFTDNDGITFSGRMLEAILERRVIYDDYFFSGALEDGIRAAVSDNAVTARAIPGLELGEINGIRDTARLTAEWDNLSEWLYANLKEYGASYKISLDPESSNLKFSVYRGLNRTSDQNTYDVAYFSEDFGGFGSIEYLYDKADFRNTAYVCGGDGYIETVNESGCSGLSMREIYVSAKDIMPDNFPYYYDYKLELIYRGRDALKECSEEIYLKGEKSDSQFPIYREGYDLGDLCEVFYKTAGIRAKVRITAVDEVFEDGKRRIIPYFGNQPLKLRGFIKREVKKTQNSL